MSNVIDLASRRRRRAVSERIANQKSGSIWGVRTFRPVAPTQKRRTCSHCQQPATHLGLGDGVVLTSGCEFYVRLWCHDPWNAIRMNLQRKGLKL